MNDLFAASPVRIAIITGDGIGPELVESAVEILNAATAFDGPTLDFDTVSGGAETFSRTGEAMSAETLERLRTEYAALMKGPVGLPEVRHKGGTEGGLLGGVLRIGLDTFANVRPIRLLQGVNTPVRHQAGEIDYVIVRENTEGLYLSRGVGVRTAHAASDQLMVTRHGCERIARYGFELARKRRGAPKDGARRVTCVDKSNVLTSYAFFRAIFDEVAAEYPDIEADYRYADAAAHDLVADPGHFDVIVTENFLGDLLSDLGAATVGGLGMCGSANIGLGVSYFEPIHGSAPAIAGKHLANPTSQVLCAAMMLDHLGYVEVAGRIVRAVETSYAHGEIALNSLGQPREGTLAATRTIISHL